MKPSIQQIAALIARYYALEPGTLQSPDRKRRSARPRQIMMYLCRRLTAASLHDIGRRLGGRDHTTVLHGQRRIKELMKDDRRLRTDVAALRLAALRKAPPPAAESTTLVMPGAEAPAHWLAPAPPATPTPVLVPVTGARIARSVPAPSGAGMSERYTTIPCTIRSVHAASLWIAVGSVGQREVNIPRTLIHGADETTLDGLLPGTKLDLRVMAWKAAELDLVAPRDDSAARGDLFASFERGD